MRVNKFVGDGTGVTVTNPTQCRRCKWLDRAHPELVRCRVFPKGIPVPILTGEADHTEPYPGDHGFRFAPIDDAKEPA